jgi:hypothetical protein
LIDELQEHERAEYAAAGKSPKQLARLRKFKGVDIRRFAAAVTEDVRKKLQAATFIYCLSADQEHPLLWSHYADSHKGVCLHFQSTHGALFGGARAVEYTEERKPVLVPLEYNQSDDDITDAMSRTKAEFWRYEYEYRIIEFGRETRLCPFEPRLLCGITLGMQISTRDRKLMLSLAAARNPVIPVYQAEEETEKFWMRIWRIA